MFGGLLVIGRDLSTAREKRAEREKQAERNHSRDVDREHSGAGQSGGGWWFCGLNVPNLHVRNGREWVHLQHHLPSHFPHRLFGALVYAKKHMPRVQAEYRFYCHAGGRVYVQPRGVWAVLEGNVFDAGKETIFGNETILICLLQQNKVTELVFTLLVLLLNYFRFFDFTHYGEWVQLQMLLRNVRLAKGEQSLEVVLL